mmetsp:Transcript_147076/g.256814  ORF Transcript_147076/g.256814 Transcript_147076/m.256814 type:complete len:213 (+) Transcript_147076:12127-12765(+)
MERVPVRVDCVSVEVKLGVLRVREWDRVSRDHVAVGVTVSLGLSDGPVGDTDVAVRLAVPCVMELHVGVRDRDSVLLFENSGLLEIDAVSLKNEALMEDRDQVGVTIEGVCEWVGDGLRVALNVSETDTVMLGLGDSVPVWDTDGRVGVTDEQVLLRVVVAVANMLPVVEAEKLLDTGEPLTVKLGESVAVRLGVLEWVWEKEGESVPHDGV